MMQRIVATLFALAGLLDRAVYAPRPLRWFLVRLLLPVEPIVRRFVFQTGWEAGGIGFILPDSLPPECGTSRAVASHLADCFHALAVALQSLPRQLYQRWRAAEALQRALRRLLKPIDRPAPQPAPLAQATPSIIDTS